MAVSTRTALLQALREGPAYGQELIERVRRISRGHLVLSEARVYPVLQSLARKGLLRASRVAPGGRRGGRSRTYYDLTLRGIEVSSEERAILAALVARGATAPRAATADLASMADRVLQTECLSAAGEELKAAPRKRG